MSQNNLAGLVGFMVFSATFDNISVIWWLSVLLVVETRVLWEKHRPVTCHWQTLSHNAVESGIKHHNPNP